VQNAQYVLKPHCRFTCLQLNDEANANPSRERKLRLCQTKSLSGCPRNLAKCLRGVDVGSHERRFSLNFLFGKLWRIG
jgi:hypothetical protein